MYIVYIYILYTVYVYILYMCDLDRNILRIEQKFTNDPQTDLDKPRPKNWVKTVEGQSASSSKWTKYDTLW